MAGSTPLQQWRQAGRWLACLDRIWRDLEERHGKSAGTREMIVLVRAGSVEGWDRLVVAVEKALRLGVRNKPAYGSTAKLSECQGGSELRIDGGTGC